MKFKTKMIAGACLAVCSSASFAVTASCPSAAPTTSAAATAYVQNCAPDYTVFVGGASTQSANFPTILTSQVLSTSKMTPIKILDKGSASGIAGNVLAYFGQDSAGKKVLAIFNFNNGSAGGVSQLLGKPSVTDIPESDVVFVGPAKTSISAGGTAANAFCLADSTSSDTAPVVSCTSHTPQQADLALSDVAPAELYALYVKATNKLSTLTAKPLFVQSFGVAVSPSLYTALQVKNGLTGCTLPASTDTAAQIAACQPNISMAEYASLVASGGKIKSLAALTGDTTLTAPLTLARRDDLSGTQAVSNIFFVNGQCSPNAVKAAANTKSVDAALIKAGGLVGGLGVDAIGNSTTSLNILSAVTSGAVKNAVANATAYAIGVLNVGGGGAISNSDTTVSAKGRFIKIDGISPNYYNGAADSRSPIISGTYPMAFTAYASYVTATKAKWSAEKQAAVTGLITGFASADTGSLLSGVAYLDGSTTSVGTPVQAKFGRYYLNSSSAAVYSNCAPITKL